MVAGLCRVARRGLRVAPFKPQNMALQQRCDRRRRRDRTRASTASARRQGWSRASSFNPVLIKPELRHRRATRVARPAYCSNFEAREFGSLKRWVFAEVIEAFERLREEFDCVVVEGAGSPAEVNLRRHDSSPT